MGAIRNLTLQIGMASFNVALCKATNDRADIALNQLHKPCMAKVKQQLICTVCNKEVLPTEKTSGYEHAPGKFVEITDVEKASIKLQSTGAIQVLEVVKLEEFARKPLLLTGQAYYLTPPKKEKFAPAQFAIIRQGLEESGVVCIGKTVLYNHEHVVAILPTQTGMIMHMLRNEDEIRAEEGLALPAVDPRQAKLAGQILEALEAPTLNINSTDQYEASLKHLIDSKVAGVAPTMPVVQAAPMPASSFEDMLKATLANIKKNNQLHDKAQPAETKPAEEKPAKKARKKTA